MVEQHPHEVPRPRDGGPVADPWSLVLRELDSLRGDVRGVREAMLTRDQFIEYQRGTDLRFLTLERRQAEWEAKSEKAHGELSGRIEAVDEKVDERDEKVRAWRSQVWLVVGGTILAFIAPRVWEALAIGAGQ